MSLPVKWLHARLMHGFIIVTMLLPSSWASESLQPEEGAVAQDQARITGTVNLPDPPSPAVMARRYEIISRGGTLSIIPPVGVVWLEGDISVPSNPSPQKIVQKNFTFEPALLAIPVGTEVSFPNEDGEYHNVFSYSSPARFDLGRYLPEERPIPSQVFNNPGMVTLRCDIHEHMRAIILVVPNEFYAMTDTDGQFELNNLPVGDYTLKVWVDSRTTLEKAVSLRPGEALDLNFE